MENKVTIIGGGIIGLSLGWQLARKGREVEIFERDIAGRGACWIAAGMLAPQAEMGFEEIELFRLCMKSLELYPKFLDELFEDCGIRIEVEKCGSLMPGFDRDDSERLRRLYDFREKVGLPVRWVTGSEARELEPLLSPKCTNAIWVPGDGQIDNRKLMNALLDAFHKRGGKIHEIANVNKINIENNRVASLIVNDKEVRISTLVVAAGAWSKQIDGLPESVLPPVRPVKGQILSLRMNADFKINHAIRAPDVYLVPKKDGRLIVGASNEEMGFDTNPTAGEIFRLLERGWETVPAIYDLPIEEIQVGLRPGSRDHEPIIGDSGIEGLYFATGHYRNGILLAPITAYELSDWMINSCRSVTLEHFQLSRFYKEIVK